MTRAKFRCVCIEDYGLSKKVKLQVVYAPDGNAEDRNFTRATPNGECYMTIDNPAAAVQFEVGKNYYADFHEAEPG